ncbi:glutamate mutase L [Blastococcus brunescens]|uniref:Glutamate mutase L n=1 Tax=Blastococcus brunescens TaxID=1564165 RepID=A0ABZ1AZQ5_9ACTN|nr:glutamate mutase L [Blastococcus sp. BMG 8361]WRL64042.1 glutamate mutase L [Blastococcus sp. BMG 8361]
MALRRHLRAEAAYGPGGASARSARMVVLSGGVFRHADPAAVEQVLARLAEDAGGAGSVLNGKAVIVDRRYVLAAVGLLAEEHPEAAAALAQHLLSSTETVTPLARRR